MPQPSPLGRFFGIAVRIIVMTVAFTALGMGVGMFVGIFGTLIVSSFRHTHPDMANSYRQFAIPLAILCGAVTLIYQVTMEVFSARRSRT